MNKQDCRIGMVVCSITEGFKAVVVKVNPKKARVRLIEDMQSGRNGGVNGSLWNIPYGYIEPVVDKNLNTEMTMRSFEQPENKGIKVYFAEKKADDPVDFPEGSPEWHIVKAICELWRRLEDDSLEGEAKSMKDSGATNFRRHQTIVNDLRFKYSTLINKMFSALGREVSKDAAERWESGVKELEVF